MGELAEFYRAWDNEKKKTKAKRLKLAEPITQQMECHTPYHYSTWLNDKRVDYWPSTNKWRYRDRNYHGDARQFADF